MSVKKTVSKSHSKGNSSVDNFLVNDMATAPCIVGIGASAGGFHAISNFLQALTADSGVAYVIVQHLDPSHPSLSAQLFGKYTMLPVAEASDGVLVEANHIYTSPPGQDITVKNGHLCLSPRGENKHLHMPIDRFFNSLGMDRGTRAIGIVLSGSGTDGALGIKTIAANEGIILVQDPATAEFDSMPRNAIATGIVNYVLRAEQMPQVIADYARHPYATGPVKMTETEDDPKSTRSLIKILQARRGYDFTGYKQGTFMRRIQRRMGLHGILQKSKYVDLLKKDTAEVDALFHDLFDRRN